MIGTPPMNSSGAGFKSLSAGLAVLFLIFLLNYVIQGKI